MLEWNLNRTILGSSDECLHLPEAICVAAVACLKQATHLAPGVIVASEPVP